MADDDLRYELETPPEERRRGSPLRPLLAGLLLLAIGVAATIWWLGRRSERVAPAVPAAATAPAAAEGRGEAVAPPAAESVALPPLDASDGFVRARLTPLASAPAWAAWLANDDLARRAVAAAARIAEGKSPREALGALEAIAPQGSFAVRSQGGRLWIDPSTYARYDRLVDVARTLDVAAAAPVLRLLRPLAELAWREQAPPEQPLGPTLLAALDHLLAVPLPPDEVEVRLEEGLYRYADPALESLTPAQKQLLRLGRERAAIVRRTLGELRAVLATG